MRKITNGYEYFLLSTITLQDNTDITHLLFGMLEGWPTELGRPEFEYEDKYKDEAKKLCYCRKVISADEAEAVIDNVRTLHTITIRDVAVDVGECEAVPAQGKTMLALNGSDEADIPYIAKTWGKCRLSSYVPKELSNIVVDCLSNFNCKNKLDEWLTWDIGKYSEWLGSLNIVLPNPLYRYVEVSLMPATGDKGEQVAIEFMPRRDISLEGLRIEYYQEKAYGIVDADVRRLEKDNFITIPMTGRTEKFAMKVYHDEYGLLDFYQPTSFIRNIAFSISMSDYTKKITEPHTGKTYTVPHYTDSEAEIGSARVENDFFSRSLAANQLREKEKKVARSGQIIFTNGVDEAKEHVRCLIGRARRRVVIVDPYFAFEELYSFVMAIQHNVDSVVILTSEKHLSGRSRTEINGQRPGNRDALNTELQHHKDFYQKMNLKIYSMTSDQQHPVPFHDRFLIIDDTCWFMGASLNYIGNRYSCMVKLVDGGEIKCLVKGVISDRTQSVEIRY